MAGKGKMAVTGLATILLVAMVVAAIVVVSNKSSHSEDQINSSSKAAQALCSNTDYKETCHKSLQNSDSTDPKKLIQAAFDYTIQNIDGVVKESAAYKEASKDKSVRDAFDVCEDVLNTAIDDMKRSFEKIGEYDDSDRAEEVFEDLKIWLSAVRTYQETCIDAFENTEGNTGEGIKNLLKTAKELASNGLAMLDTVSSLFTHLNVDASEAQRKLLANMMDYDYSLRSAGRSLYDYNSAPAGMANINAVVAQDGSAEYRTINEAIKKIPAYNNNTYVIYIKAGIYKEEVIIPKYTNKVVLLGEGPKVTRITATKNYADGIKTFYTATVAVNGDDLVAKDIGFENSAGPEKHQAVALRITGDRAVIFNCHIDGYQDSLYAHTYRQYYRNCRISGTIDFVFGDALAVFQNCTFVVRRPMDNQACMVTAQGRVDPRSQGAIVIQGGKIVAAPEFLTANPPLKAYLGRPWKQLSRTIIMQSNIEGFIVPEGWSAWNGTFGLDTCYYAEYQNKGPGSDSSKRVTWMGIRHIDQATAEGWTPGRAYNGDSWITNAAVPYDPGMTKM